MTSRACAVRLVQCTALLADWARVADGSASFLTIARAVGRTAGNDWLRSMRWIRSLLGDATVATEGRISLADATQASGLFKRFYYHAVPFEAASLLDLWNRCADTSPAAERCLAGRRAARRLASVGHPPSLAE